MITLIREEYSDHGTFGRILGLDLYTGELPWKENKRNISCIPNGVYGAIWTFSPHLRKFTYELLVEDRSGIRIHSGNYVGDIALGYKAQVNGCITLGEKLGFMEGQKCILISRPAVSTFEFVMERKPFKLEIRGP